MKNIFKALLYGCLLSTGMGLSGCSDDQDEIIDSITLSRVLSPTNIEVKVTNGCDASFSWDKMVGASGYVVEIFSDYEYTELYTREDVSESRLNIKLSNEDTYFFAQIKAISNNEGIADSKWTKYDSIQTSIYYAPLTLSNVGTGYYDVTFAWDGEIDIDLVSFIRIGNTDYEVSAEEIELKSKFIEGLEEDTEYTATLYYNTTKRGSVKFTTKSTKAINVTTSEELLQAMEDISEGGTIIIANDISLLKEETGAYSSLKFNRSITIKGDDDSKVLPVISAGDQWTVEGTIGVVKLANLRITIAPGKNYLFNNASSLQFDLEALEISNCEIEFAPNEGRSLFRTQASTGQVLRAISLTNSIITNAAQESQNYGVFHFAATVKNELPLTIDITDCTFNTVHSLIQYAKLTATSGTEVSIVNIERCTFYNVFSSGQSSVRYFIELTTGGKSVADDVVNVNSCVFALSNPTTIADSPSHSGIRAANLNVKNTYTTSDFLVGLYPIEGAVGISDNAAAIFLSPSTGDFTLTNATLKENAVGDPRWN